MQVYFYFPSDVFVRKIDRDGRLLNQFLQPHVKTNASNISFTVNSVSTWNNLLADALRTQSLVTFKRLTLPLFSFFGYTLHVVLAVSICVTLNVFKHEFI